MRFPKKRQKRIAQRRENDARRETPRADAQLRRVKAPQTSARSRDV